MPFIDAHGNAIIDAASSLTMSLHSGDPSGDGSANEIFGGSYARKSVTMAAASGKTSANTNTATFDDLPAVTVTHAALWEASNGKYYGPLSSSHDVAAGESLQFGPGDVTITLT